GPAGSVNPGQGGDRRERRERGRNRPRRTRKAFLKEAALSEARRHRARSTTHDARRRKHDTACAKGADRVTPENAENADGIARSTRAFLKEDALSEARRHP